MDWTAAVDIYCERTGPEFWAEPLNALSNLSFVAAAVWAAISARKRQVRDPEIWLLILLAALIGLGSFLFHSLAQVWSGFADTVPIWTFVAVFVLVGVHRIGGVAPGRIVVGAVVVAAVIAIVILATADGSAGGQIGPDPLNGSGQYAPAVLGLSVFSAISLRRRHPGARLILLATIVFLISLVFRTIDRDICPALPIGTHFLWHALNGLMIALLLQMILRTSRPAAG